MNLFAFLFKKIDNSQLVIFRVFYGFLICCETYGALITGWVRRVLAAPTFTFSFIGFEWLQPLPGNGMYVYFFIMGTLGIMIMLGYKYRFSALAFALLWAGVYLMQKTSYNNHYYLLFLLAFIMAFLPANRNFSLDAKLNPKIRTDYMFNYVRWTIILQLFIVYTYAAAAKLYADWLDFTFIEVLMGSKKDYFLIGKFLQQPWAHKIIAAYGIFFDLLVVPALLWKPTRKIAFGLGVFFHLFNSFVFGIGIFPYLALAFCIFFFDPAWVRRVFIRKPIAEKFMDSPVLHHSRSQWLIGVLAIYFVFQIVLPLRHHTIPGNVVWTEEGHRLSWRMMLRSRSGYVKFKVVDNDSNKEFFVDLSEYLSKKQQRRIGSYPDFIWQFAQRIKKEHAEKGQNVAVYAIGKAKVNQGKYYPLIDPKVDLTSVKWNHFSRNEWILIPEEYR